MRTFALSGLFVVALVAALFGMVMWSRAQGEIATFSEWGVCIDAPDPRYNIEASMPADFSLVDVVDGEGRGMRVYIGNYPQLDQAALEAGRKANGAMTPVPGEEGQFVAVRTEPNELILHVMLDAADSERARLLGGVRFCPDAAR